MEPIIFIIFQILIVLFSVVIHEVSHGVAAYSMGDDTAKRLGRLTLNPIKHLDPFGSVLLPLVTLILGGFIFGYAKPVPYNPANLSDKKYGPAKVAIAGPLSNFVVAFGFGTLLRFMPLSLEATLLPDVFVFIVLINLVLGIFNLMPVPPLDGHWLVLTFLPDKYYKFKMFFQQFGIFLFILLLFVIFPIVFPLVQILFKVFTGSSIII